MDHTPGHNIFVTQMLMRDLFAVANLHVYINIFWFFFNLKILHIQIYNKDVGGAKAIQQNCI